MTTYSKALPCTGTSASVSLQFVITEGSINQPGNSNVVNWTARLYKSSTAGYPYSNAVSSTIVCRINNVVVLNKSTKWSFETMSGTTGYYNFGSGSYTLAHNPDGTKTHIAMSAVFTDSSGIIGNGTASGYFDFTRIYRTIKAFISGVWEDVQVWVNDAGVWKKTLPWLNDSGTWKNPS